LVHSARILALVCVLTPLHMCVNVSARTHNENKGSKSSASTVDTWRLVKIFMPFPFIKRFELNADSY